MGRSEGRSKERLSLFHICVGTAKRPYTSVERQWRYLRRSLTLSEIQRYRLDFTTFLGVRVWLLCRARVLPVTGGPVSSSAI